MKRKLLFAVTCLLFTGFLQAQQTQQATFKKKNYRNFPIVAGIQFHSFSVPFKDMGAGFSNVGLMLGTEFSFNGRQNWVQGFTIGGYRNKHAGDGAFAFTQTIYRPTIYRNFFAEIKAGVGVLHNFHPVDVYKEQNGEWINAGKKGKTMLMAPVGLGFGFNSYKEGIYFSPFVSYELFLSKDYNDLLPLVPGSVIQIGTRIHL
ncbi:MAG: hypothetical protein H7Z13_14465 [Ferruginibacter sp.]|nr:hypothetical protein [Ferruginibacter sp.]